MSSRRTSKSLRLWQVALLLGLFVFWHVATHPTLIPPFYFDNPNKAAFFFGQPLEVLGRIWTWFSSGSIYGHLWVTLLETVLAFVVGTVSGLAVGLWLALSPTAAALFDPYIKAVNSMPRVILAPIFGVWFGLGMASKVALGVTLGFFKGAVIDAEASPALLGVGYIIGAKTSCIMLSGGILAALVLTPAIKLFGESLDQPLWRWVAP